MGNDAVGYKKPPKNTRFQKGRSGNPGGRPKVTQTLSAALDEVLNQKVPVTVRGKKVKRTYSDIIAMKLVTKAAEGNLAAMAMIERTQSRASLVKERAQPGDLHDVEYNVTLQLEEAPACPPDMMRMCEEMEGRGQSLPPEWAPLRELGLLLKEHVRATKHLLPDALKHLAE